LLLRPRTLDAKGFHSDFLIEISDHEISRGEVLLLESERLRDNGRWVQEGRWDVKLTLRHDDPSRRYDSEELSDIACCWG
jgi:hypothetical protein